MARRRPSRSKLALRWVGAGVLVLIALSYIHPLRSYRHAQSDVADRQSEISSLERDNRELARKLIFAGKTEFVLREARRLGIVREGEHLFIIKGVGGPEERPVP